MLVSKKVSVTTSKKFVLEKSRGIGLKNFGLGNGLKDLQLTARRYIVFNLFSSETISYKNSYQLLRRYELQIFGSSHGKETPTNVISKFDWKRYFWIIITCLAYDEKNYNINMLCWHLFIFHHRIETTFGRNGF